MEGRVEIYCGQGRGKTSCAIGQCVKAAGQEKQIIMVQFLKGKETEELSFFKRLEPEVQLFRFEKYERLYEDLNEEEKKEQDHFIYNGLNMTNIQSRPLQNKNWEYRFFVDFEGRFEDHAVQNALRGLREETIAFRILGTY